MNKYANVSASGLIKTGTGRLAGIVINSHASGVIKIWDSTTASGSVIFNTITLTAVATTGERMIDCKDLAFSTGLYFQLVSGSADLTFIYH